MNPPMLVMSFIVALLVIVIVWQRMTSIAVERDAHGRFRKHGDAAKVTPVDTKEN